MLRAPPACQAPRAFSPQSSGARNARALQRAVRRRRVVTIDCPGTYDIAATIILLSGTHLTFGAGVVLRKVRAAGARAWPHVLMNRGALTRTYDENITVRGLSLEVNGVEAMERDMPVAGLRGQVALFYVRNVRITHFRCFDLGAYQFALHVCTFEGVVIEDTVVHGRKDGIHFGRGRGFVVRDYAARTFDDAIALNAEDYCTSNPELGWIRDGLIENVTDLAAPRTVGFFARCVAGTWRDWFKGMSVRHSDTVVSGGAVYRVFERPGGTTFSSTVRPEATHVGELFRSTDRVPWRLVQREVLYTAGVSNVTFRTLRLQKRRPGIVLMFTNNAFSRSVYPGAQPLPVQGPIVLHDVEAVNPAAILVVKTPSTGVRIESASGCHRAIQQYCRQHALPFVEAAQ